MAMGKNHIGTMAGKLNGEMMPTTPSGCRTEATSTLVEALAVMPPLRRWEMPQANSTTSWPRATSPTASEHLAVLGGDDRDELGGAGVEQLAEAEQDRGAASERGVAPLREGRAGGGDHVFGVGGGGQRDPLAGPAGGGVVTSAYRSVVGWDTAPSAQWWMVSVMTGSSSGVVGGCR
jgi:hypothetical protein